MPIDSHEDEDSRDADASSGSSFAEFDCPDCNANNPADPPLVEGAEALCNYCGTLFAVKVTDGGKMKLREI